MALNACLFAAAPASTTQRAVLEARLERLVAYYRPLGDPRLSLRHVGDHALLGTIRFDGRTADLDAPLSFADHVPAEFSKTKALLAAGDSELRSMDACVALMAADDRQVRIVTGPVPPTTLYRAERDGTEVWSTHAAAAAFLAGGEASLNVAALPELMTAEMVGGRESILVGVSPVEPASTIAIGPRGETTRVYWPARERWAPVPEADAIASAEDALLASLQSRLDDRLGIVAGLTAGLDSRVAGLALRELGIDFSGYTWGVDESPDVHGARALAEQLGIEHRYQPIDWYAEGDEMRRVDASARWTEGGMPVGFGVPTVPQDMRTLVTGAGGETGRAFYYRYAIAGGRLPTERLGRVMAGALASRAAGMDRERRQALRDRYQRWADDAIESSGLIGWRALDVLYTQQRVGRWLRTMLARGEVPMIGAFTPPEVARALVSMSWRDRATDAFHREFIARREPGLSVSRPTLRPTRRRVGSLLAPWRRYREDRIRPAQAGESAHRPGYIEWLTDGVLDSPLLEEALGRGWTSRVREGLLAGDPRAEYAASWAAAPVAFGATLGELRDGRG